VWRRLAADRLLDRLTAGKAWIALVAFALIGIVTLQLGLLELNTGIGRVLERESTLQRENAALSIANSEMASGSRVEGEATKLGMPLVPEGAVRFLSAHPSSDVTHAASTLGQQAHPASTSRESASAEPSQGESSATRETSSHESSGGESSGSEGSAGESSAPAASGESRSSSAASQESSGAHEPASSETGSAAGGAEASPGG
jgi:hypothetical protein